ncbi:MAG TPA: hypothetical protein VGC36_04125, partial [Rhizomicrobium sp.]
IAFEPGPLTGGESCRDPIAAILAIEGTVLDAALARRLSAVFGGPRGCSHILTLAQVLAAATVWALDTAAQVIAAPGWRAGERIFRRDLLDDGSQRVDGDLDLAAQLTDLVFAPAAAIARPMDRYTAMHEVRVCTPVELATISLGEVSATERRRERASLDDAEWSDASPRLGGLAGLSLFRGISAALMARLPESADRPLLDAMLMLAPTFIQVCGAISESWPARAAAADSILGMGGMPDSCFMWRKGGPLDRLRTPQDPIPTF